MKTTSFKAVERLLFVTVMIFIIPLLLSGQGFLHTEGKQIVDGNGENVILRGIGTGNWMLQEGYMMESSGVAGTQHEFRQKLIETIGEALTDSFYTVWLENHMTRTDVDSMAAWGFNSVRVAMHYKWFTLPIEKEPVAGEQSWLDKGFVMIDSLLDWCGDHEMYLVLDMHGAPGGQGKDAAISDYDPSKPSLWESRENKDKLVALWARLADRYSDEPWMGGYDLVNETNWTFPEGNNSQMRALFMQITDSIRAVDPNHMIIIEGNWFANDFSGLTPPWDTNMVYSFHKYWTYNNASSLNWVLDLRNRYNVPIWLGESGENSNTWFTNLISLCESNNIGWSWWPVKKGGINNVLRVDVNDDYRLLIDNWRGTGPMLSPDEAFQAVLTFAENHRIGNCHHQRDVVDAMIRQPYSAEALPFLHHTVRDTMFATDYDLGRNGIAWFDQDSANYALNMNGEFTTWNHGWSYRNDGVDIERCTDSPVTNGYNVGWTQDGEWLNYTLISDSSAACTMELRSASGGGGSRIHVEVNGVDATGTVILPGTGGWQSWTTTTIEDVILPGGEVQIRIVFERGGSNLNWFRFKEPKPVSSLPFRFVSARSAELKNEVYIALNKLVTTPGTLPVENFTLTQSGVELELDSVQLSEKDDRVLILTSPASLFYNRTLEVSYQGSAVMHDQQLLESFTTETVQNLMAKHFPVPGRIQAEHFHTNHGLELESCSDAGGGYNTGFADPGDWLDYLLFVEEAGAYDLDFRIATERGNAKLEILADRGTGFEALQTVAFNSTGGWQSWTTQSTTINLVAGKQMLRLLVTGGEHNLNWFELKTPVSIVHQRGPNLLTLYPNPASDYTMVEMEGYSGPVNIEIVNSPGRVVYRNRFTQSSFMIDTAGLTSGLYIVRLDNEGVEIRKRLIIGRN
ncbi:MAG: carbohydrate-binding protein [Bacteroidota bacterium]